MRSALIALVGLCASATAAHAQDARVDTFRSICINARESFATTEAAALSQGWVAVSETSRPELRRMFEFVRGAIPADVPVSALRAYGNERFADGAIVLTELTVQSQPVHGCYVYDFSATERIAPEVFVQIVGAEPTETQNLPGEIFLQKWIGPASLDGVASMRIGFIPRGSEAGAQVGLVGLSLALTSFSQTNAQ